MLNKLDSDIKQYKIEKGLYPDSLQQLIKHNGISTIIKDPLQEINHRKNSFYIYKKEKDQYKLFSSGKDGIPNTSDDFYPETSNPGSAKTGLLN